MDLDNVMELITTDDVTTILTNFGSSYPILDNQGNLLFDTNVSHGGDSRHKLCYFIDSKRFYCYSRGYGLSLIDIIMYNLNVEFSKALNWLKKFKGITSNFTRLGFSTKKENNEDFEFLNTYLPAPTFQDITLKTYNDGVLDVFHELYPASWYKEGISPLVAESFDLRYCLTRNACIIPYRDVLGRLIGIRQRNFNEEQVLAGRKYIPTIIEGVTYSYPTSLTFYGIYEHQDHIRETKEAVIFESEKSVLLHASFYSSSNALGLGGSAFSKKQRQLLLDLGVESVVISLDKDYDEGRLNDKSSKDYHAYASMVKKLKKMVSLLSPYFKVSVILCFDERLGLKDSAVDRGKETYESLYRTKYVVTDADELNVLLD